MLLQQNDGSCADWWIDPVLKNLLYYQQSNYFSSEPWQGRRLIKCKPDNGLSKAQFEIKIHFCLRLPAVLCGDLLEKALTFLSGTISFPGQTRADSSNNRQDVGKTEEVQWISGANSQRT